MPRAYHYPTRHHITNELGHWEMTIENGRVVDVWVRHCEAHQFTTLPCEHCRINILTTTQEGDE